MIGIDCVLNLRIESGVVIAVLIWIGCRCNLCIDCRHAVGSYLADINTERSRIRTARKSSRQTFCAMTASTGATIEGRLTFAALGEDLNHAADGFRTIQAADVTAHHFDAFYA